MLQKKILAVALTAAMGMSLAACGQQAAPAPSSPAEAKPAAEGSATEGAAAEGENVDYGYVQGVTDGEILIGNSAAVSGAYASVGVPFIAGIQAYLDMVNEAGGIDGRKVTFVHYDDEFDPVKGKSYLQELVEDDQVFAMVGHFGTPVVAATVDDLKEYGIPSVYFATGIGQLYAKGAETNADGYNIFPVQPIYTTEGQIMVARGVGFFGAKKIGVIYTSDDAGKNMYDGATAKAEELGVEIVAEQVAAGAADVSSAVTSLKDAGVDFVIIAAIQATMPTIAKEMASQGMTVPAITTYVNVSAAISEQVAADTEGVFDVYGNGWVSFEDERAQNLELYQKWVDAEFADNTYAQTGWIAAAFFCEGAERVAGAGLPLTWKTYMEALESAPLQNPFGGTIDYAAGNRAGTEVMNLSKISSAAGGWELVDGLKSMDELLK